MIRIDALRTFVEVADHGNIREAAEKLCRTPSAVTMTLKQVEDQLGCPLFETDRKSSLTETGQFLLQTAEVVLRDYDRAMERIFDHARARDGRLRIASVPSVATMLLPEALRSFMADRPSAAFDLVDSDSTDVRAMVASGEVDLGIAGAADAHPGLEFAPLFSDPFLLVCRRDALPEVPPDQPLHWFDLDNLPLILNESTRALHSEAFRRLADRSRLSVRNVSSLIAMVQSGMGATILPALATRALPDSLAAHPIADPACRRQVGVYWRAGRVLGPLAAAFRQTLDTLARSRPDALWSSL